jgi:xylulokinase
MTTPREAVLAIDLGTSSVKTLVVSADGRIVGRGQASYPTLHPRDGYDEQMVDDWLQAVVSAVASARRFTPNTEIRAIGITGQMHGTVLLDRDGLPIHPAIIWSDRRAAGMVGVIHHRLGDDLPAIIGGPIGTGYQSLTLAWIREQRPHVWARIAHVLLPADLIGFLLTGEYATEPSNAVSTGLLTAETGTWNDAYLAELEIPEAWMPDLVPGGAQVGTLGSEAAAALDLPPGIPVVHGGGDAAAAAVGGHVLTPADAMITLSTGAQVIRPVSTYTPEPTGRWHTWPSALPAGTGNSRWLSVGAILNGGRAIDWIHRTLAPGMPIADLMEFAQSAPSGSENLLFLPYLAGERSPLLDPYARGAFIGLSDAHEPRHLVRAVLEGIALALTDTLERMTPNTSRLAHIVFGGGGSSLEIRQIMANVLGVPLSIPPTQESSALGAASLAAHSLGWTTLGRDDRWGQEFTTILQPVQADHDRYEERLALFRDATGSLLPIMHRLQQREP